MNIEQAKSKNIYSEGNDMSGESTIRGLSVLLFFFIGISLSIPGITGAHCDTLTGPVVTDAKKALEKKDVIPVLKWVKKEHEGEIRESFEKTLAVRIHGKESQELADRYFFETLVRLHRAGENAPYLGLNEAERIEPLIIETDKALESGSVDNLVKMVSDTVSEGIRERFKHAFETRKHSNDSVQAGRVFVSAYVEFTHYVEMLYLDAGGGSGCVFPEKGKAEKHHQ
jgi:hypothetical protein